MSLTSSALSLAALILTCGLTFIWWRRVRRMAHVSASIPGPRAYPIFGNLFYMSRKNIQNAFQAVLDEYGYLVRMWFGPLLVVFVMDAEDLEVVLTSTACANKPTIGYHLAGSVIGNGLVDLNGADHRRHRKLIMPSMHRDVLNQIQPLMQIVATELVDEFRPKAASGEVFNATPFCGVVTINSTYRTLLNADGELYEAHREQRNMMAANVDRLSELLMYRLVRPWCWFDALFQWDREWKDYQRFATLYDNLLLDVMAHKMDTSKAARSSEGAFSSRRRQVFLDHILSSEEGRSLTKKELFNELKTMTAASFITSMDSLSVQLLILSLMPTIQAKIHAELDDVFGGSDRPMELSDLDHLEYLERFVKEGLRYYPPFPILGRTCSEDVPLPSGHTLPAGCLAAMSPVVTHHNPKYYPDPKHFDPDRFLPEEVAKRPSCAFIAFSAGPRSCIGARYALMFLKTMLANVLRCYTLLPNPQGPQDIKRIRMRLGFSYFPKDGCRIRIQARKQSPVSPPAAAQTLSSPT